MDQASVKELWKRLVAAELKMQQDAVACTPDMIPTGALRTPLSTF